jgi:hypothetical protein
MVLACEAGPTASVLDTALDAGGCATGRTQSCYDGPAGSLGVGACAPGVRVCSGESWGECEGQVLPRAETCDGADDDCDGEADDGARGPCGDCDETCTVLSAGPADAARPAPLPVLWVRATTSTVSRVDTEALSEVGRYRTAPDPDSEPRAVAVDFEGNAFVANGSVERRAGVTKFFAECPDADRDGTVETSAGRADVRPFGEDECVGWYTPVGCGVGDCGETGAIAFQSRADEGPVDRVWVNLADEDRFVELDAWTGAETGAEADCGECRSTGATIDADGILWAACGIAVCRVDTRDPDDVQGIVHPPFNEGVAVDAEGRVWTGGNVEVYEEGVAWYDVSDAAGLAPAMGLDGSVWIPQCPGGDGTGTICRVDAGALVPRVLPIDVRFVTVDARGRPWGFGASIVVVDPEVEAAFPVLADCDGPGTRCVEGPVKASDMTGTALRIAADPPAEWRTTFAGCDGGPTLWRRLDWTADVPADAAVRVDVRAAVGESRLAERAWIPAASLPGDAAPVDLEPLLGPDRAGTHLELRATFLGDAALAEVRIHRSCG